MKAWTLPLMTSLGGVAPQKYCVVASLLDEASAEVTPTATQSTARKITKDRMKLVDLSFIRKK